MGIKGNKSVKREKSLVYNSKSQTDTPLCACGPFKSKKQAAAQGQLIHNKQVNGMIFVRIFNISSFVGGIFSTVLVVNQEEMCNENLIPLLQMSDFVEQGNISIFMFQVLQIWGEL